MRYVNALLCTMMILFALVQYNDPDGPLWAAIYAIPAAFAGLAAFQPQWLSTGTPRFVLMGTLIASLAFAGYSWPTTPEFWRVEVWWHTETAREGLGTLITFIVLLSVFLSTLPKPSRAP